MTGPDRGLLLALVLVGCGSPAPEAPETAPPPTTAAPETPAQRRPAGRQGGPGPQRGGKAPGRGQRQGRVAFEVVEQDGMVKVPAGWTQLGLRRVPPPAGARHSVPAPGRGKAPGRGQPGATGAAAHGAGGAARAAGAPPARVEGRALAAVPGEALPWRFRGGNGMDPTAVWLEAFWIDRTEVTRADYARFLTATGYRPPHVDEAWARDGWNWDGARYPDGTGDHPVVLASWYDAQEYCAWAGKRLPTEAEWQLAALGPTGQDRHYPWGDQYDESKLNHGMIEAPNFDASDGYRTTSPVGSFPAGASPFGALDMFGNAWEFTADHRVDTWALMESRPHPGGLADARAPGPGLYVAVRGGSYFFDLAPNPAGERHHFLPEIRRKTSGFRCARGAD